MKKLSNTQIIIIVAIVLTLLSTMGCGGNNSQNSDINPTEEGASSNPNPTIDDDEIRSLEGLTGLYDLSKFVYDGYARATWNEKYILIEENQLITEFDYQGDETNRGANCYSIEKYNVAPIDGGLFTWYDSEGYGEIVSITVDEFDEFLVKVNDWIMIKGYKSNQHYLNFNLCN